MSILRELVNDTRKAIEEGYYDLNLMLYHKRIRLSHAIINCKDTPIIGEIKFFSPVSGTIREYSDPVILAKDMLEGGVIGISVVTNRMFNGRLDYLLNVRIGVDIPLLMKDIIISEKQIDAAYRCGADCILLISSILDKDDRDRLINYAHNYGLEVLLEVHNKDQFIDALSSDADMIGINNRDLDSMKIDITTTEQILSDTKPLDNKIVISESGIESRNDIARLKRLGVKAFLVGSSIMRSKDISLKVRELRG